MFKPTGVNVLIRAVKIEKKGGILIPSSSQYQDNKAEVVAVGPDVSYETLPVMAGDIVFVRTFGFKVKIDNEEMFIVKYEDLLGVA